MKPSLYVETSVVSYLTARPSGNLVAAARQHLTRTWWEPKRRDYDLFISPLVLDEAGRGDAMAATARLDALSGLPVVAVPPEASSLADAVLRDVPLPDKAAADAVHIATAAVSGAVYLATWNLKHIANPVLQERISRVCRSFGYEPPTLCTPEVLLELSGP